MANEITQVLSLTVRNSQENASSPYIDSFNSSRSFDQSGIGGRGSHTVTVTTSEEDLWMGDLSTPGVLLLHNLDDTNSVIYGPRTGTGTGTGTQMEDFAVLKPGDVHRLQLQPSVTLRWRASAGSVVVDVRHYEA